MKLSCVLHIVIVSNVRYVINSLYTESKDLD